MLFLAKLNKFLKFRVIRYVVWTPNEYVYNNLNQVALFVQFGREVYRIDGISRSANITRDLVYSAIDRGNKTHISEFRKNIEGEVDYIKECKGSSGRVLSEIFRIR